MINFHLRDHNYLLRQFRNSAFLSKLFADILLFLHGLLSEINLS